MKRFGVVLSAVAMAVGAAVMAGPAAAAPGVVLWGDSHGDWHRVENPNGCYDTPDGRYMNNRTLGVVTLYSSAGCKGQIVYKVAPGESVPPPAVYFESFEA
ncbi:hypothetical protein SAMN04487905_107209 [Actinopolyspora xinjiangensis]|uniref:Secreted protein n=1 Tax=Actinopolyspora xinjiangensis TaxID=405564 RepID=A0A1H0UXC2_9ACTN|nr:hypothetical protein SAMN04487905_107209 [Actinopolyspora xinjiangensis]